MSYILEALRRSAAERELGRVPSLEGAALLAEERVEPPRGRWALVSVALALTAVLIALYAALRSPPVPRASSPGVAAITGAGAPAHPAAKVAMVQVPVPQVPVPATPVAHGGAAQGALPLLPPIPGSVEGAAAPGEGRPGTPPAPVPPVPQVAVRSGMTPAAINGAGAPGSAPGPVFGSAPAAVGAPLVEAPPPKGPIRAQPLVSPSAPQGVPADAARPPMPDPASVRGPNAEDEAAAQLELELKREMAADPTLAQEAESASPPREDPGPTPVPPDLIAAIDAFKHQVKGGPEPNKEQSKDQNKEKGKAKARDQEAWPTPAAPPRGSAVPAVAGSDPTQLRLTREQQAALPKFLMNVHVYDADSTRRFVLINGLKYAQGARTREGLTVEEIRVDGAVLTHQGHPFFVHR